MQVREFGGEAALASLTTGFRTIVLAVTVTLFATTSALGATVTDRPLLFTIDGADAPDRPMEGAGKVAVDNATGAFYVSEGNGATVDGFTTGRIFRYHADGSPWPFSSTGRPYISLSGEDGLTNAGVAVDNSGGPNQSRLYVTEHTSLYAFDSTGDLLWKVSLPNQSSDVAVDSTGHPYVAPAIGYSDLVRKFDNSGSPPALIESISMIGGSSIDLDSASDIFIEGGAFESSVEKWVGGSFSSTLDPLGEDVYADQSVSSGHVFTTYQGRDERQLLVVDATAGEFRLSLGGAQTPDLPFDAGEAEIRAALEALPNVGADNLRVDFSPEPAHAKQVTFQGFLQKEDIEQLGCEDGTTPLSGGGGCSVSTIVDGVPGDVQEYTSAGALLGTFGHGYLGTTRSVAYNPGLDRLYVMESTFGAGGVPSLAAFGARATGTVPDVTIAAPSAVGVASAHFTGTVNPQGTTSQWRFQWRKGGESWATAAASPPLSLPADSADHTVEYTTNALRGATAYQVRLVAVNTANQLANISENRIFETSKAALAPTVTINAPSAITTSGVKITGTVNPQDDTAEWRVQTSTDPACETGFANQPAQSLSPSSATPIDVEYQVTGLLPSEHYCTRILALNSAGETTSEAEAFESEAVLPTQVFAAYAAPRSDTTARLNGYVNPQGSSATYRFEYSDDGSVWTALPEMQTDRARRQITVASELTGLQPSTTYRYRITVENGAGAVESDEKTFRTRSVAEMQIPQRGIELVNQPNKGNQALSQEIASGDPKVVSSDGNKVVWRLNGGAPTGTTGTSVSFLSRRTASGWESQPLAPPASQQIGGGSYAYKLSLVTPDFRSFLMRAEQTGAQLDEAPTFLRIDDEYHQEALASFEHSFLGQSYENSDMTTDAAHVILYRPETNQLEEIGPEGGVVSVMPDGQPAECGVPSDGFAGVPGGGSGPTGTQWRSGYHRMAVTDASRLYFEAYPNGGACSDGALHHHALYFRDRNADETIEIDPGTAEAPPALIRATPDGRTVYLLTATAHSPDDENASGDVYRWEAEGSTYTCLTCDLGHDAAISSGLPVRISDDFSHLYFSSSKQLIAGHGEPSEPSIYAVDLTNGRLRYVTTGSGQWLGSARVSENGNVLLFKSETGYSQITADKQADECTRFLLANETTNYCGELFRYEDSTESLECLSCSPGRVTTREVGEMVGAAGMSADGSTVAFVTHERVVPEDINSAPDVYEWHNGALRLISDGETDYISSSFSSAPRVYGIDETGDNIFFALVQPDLTGYEQDKALNLYDARVGGGFPRPQPPAHCSEESCQGPLQAPPAVAPVGSAGLSGSGNVVSGRKGRCAGRRGKARSRCVSKHHKRPRHARSRHAGQANQGGTRSVK